MALICCVVGSHKRGSRDKVSFFRIPSTPGPNEDADLVELIAERCQQWISAKIGLHPSTQVFAVSILFRYIYNTQFLLPARASEQGNVIGLVSRYIYIYVIKKKFVIERTRDLIYLKFVATDFSPKIISPSAGENSGDSAWPLLFCSFCLPFTRSF